MYVLKYLHVSIFQGGLEFDETLNKVFSLLPHFCLTKGTLDLSLLYAQASVMSSFGELLYLFLFLFFFLLFNYKVWVLVLIVI